VVGAVEQRKTCHKVTLFFYIHLQLFTPKSIILIFCTPYLKGSVSPPGYREACPQFESRDLRTQ